MAVKPKGYTAAQAKELDRALGAQYEADNRGRPEASDVEWEKWRRIRRASALRVFGTSMHSE